MVESNKHYNFAGHHTVDYGLIMVEAKELRVFVYLLVFFPAILVSSLSNRVWFSRDARVMNVPKKKKGLDSTPHCSLVVPHPSTGVMFEFEIVALGNPPKINAV